MDTNCLIYLRLSELRTEDLDQEGASKNLADAEKRLRGLARRRGWHVAGVATENDIDKNGKPKPASAYKRRRVTLPDGRTELRVYRPVFRSVLDDLMRGRGGANAMLAVDLDRAVRDPRDLEDLIDVAAAHRLNIDSESGSLRFTNGGTDSEVTMARVMVTMANKSSRDTGRRVSAARLRQALAGEFAGGRRPYGFEDDGITPILAEYAVIQNASRDVLADVSLNLICRDLDARNVATAAGADRWSPRTLKDILRRPRNIAKMVHRSKAEASRINLNGRVTWLDRLGVVGDAPWPPILSEEVFFAIHTKLTDPERRTGGDHCQAGFAPRWLGSGIYRCGGCGDTLEVHTRNPEGARAPVYRCRTNSPGVSHDTHDHPATNTARAACRKAMGVKPGQGCPTRNVAALDDYVTRVVIERMSRPDALDLIDTPSSGVDTAALRTEVAGLRQRLSDLTDAFTSGEIDRTQLTRGTTDLRTKINNAEQALMSALDVSPLSPLVGAEDVAAVWDSLSLGSRREVINTLMTVTILPAPRVRSFSPTHVRIDAA